MIFEHLPDSSRVWIYTSNKPLTDQKELINRELDRFITNWAAHGEQLYGAGAVLNDYFVVLAVDESKVGASGCSIDSSVAFIRSLASKYSVDLFDRMNVLIQLNDHNKLVRFSDLDSYPNCLIFDPMVTELGELRKNWLKPISVTPYA